MLNTNNTPGKTFPYLCDTNGFPCLPPSDPLCGPTGNCLYAGQLTGTPIDCSTLSDSTTTGLVAVGGVNFYDSTIGDLTVGITFVCQ
jgi:hypothetical protein